MSNQPPLPVDRAASCALAPSDIPQGILSRTLLNAPELRVLTMHFAAGEELSLHTSRRRALVQVLDGACEFFANNRWETLGVGELMHLPPDHPHAVRASPQACTLLLTLAAELPVSAS